MYTPCMTVYVMKSLQEMTCIQEAVVIITINYILGTLTLKAIDWYINKSILSGSRGGVGCLGVIGKFWGGAAEFHWATITKYYYTFGFLSSSPFDWHPYEMI